MRCTSSGSGDSSKRSACNCAKRGAVAQSGLAMVTSRAVNCGHGTSERHQPAERSRRQSTVRSPLIANVRPIAWLARSPSQGLIRFQLKVAMKITAATSSSTSTAAIQLTVLTLRLIRLFPSAPQALDRR